ncbi:MAG: HAD family phosphatase [Rikenellaceae bacterium]
MGRSAVVFDMDGVLVDNTEIHIDAFVIYCKRYGMDMKREMLRPFFGMGNDDIFPAIFNKKFTPSEIAVMAEEKELIYRDIFASKIKPQNGLIKILEDLKAKGIKMAVGSSAMRKNVDFVLDKCGIGGYFDAISCGDMISKAKPDPEVFVLAASLLGVKTTDCVVIEDAFAGVKAARAIGSRVVVLTTTYPRDQHTDFDVLIDDFTQITADELLG